jgi:hypothetical protein
MCAAIGVGAVEDYRAAEALFVRPRATIEPDHSLIPVYEGTLARYREIVELLGEHKLFGPAITIEQSNGGG